MSHRRAFVFACLIAVGIGCMTTAYQVAYQRHAGDFTWALVAAEDIIAGHNPYARPLPPGSVAYPLPAALFAMPFIWMPREIAAGVFMALSSGLLAWGLLRTGESWRLLTFAAFPYWQAVQVVNWSPLLLAVMFLPTLMPLILIKPHVGLPIALLRFSWGRMLACGLFGIVSFGIMWNWPIQWLNHLTGYAGRPALLLLPFGPVLLLALRTWRSTRSRYLLLYAAVPLRPFYDYILLWYLPHSRQEMLVLVLCSWLGYFAWFLVPQYGASQWMLVSLYLPVLMMILRPQWQKFLPSKQPASLNNDYPA